MIVIACPRSLSSTRSLLPAQAESLCDEGEDVRVFQDGLGGGFPSAVPTAGVHPHHQRLTLCGTAPHPVLQGSTVLQGVEGHHTVIVISRQKQDSRVWRARVGRGRQIVEWGIPGEQVKKKGGGGEKNSQKTKECVINPNG